MKIGIDLGGSHVAIGIVDEQGKVLEKRETKLSHLSMEEKKNTIENYIIQSSQELMQKYEITSMGIAVPGTVDDRAIIKATNLGIENYPIVEILEEKLKLPVFLGNDAKCAALAESAYGCLKGESKSLFLTLGTGIGTAVIINNQLLDTGKLPRMRSRTYGNSKDGLQCNCGKKGCFEKYGSMKTFKDNLRKELDFPEYQTGKMLAELLRNKTNSSELNEKMDKVVSEYIENLSIGISNLINIFEPEVIGIGGSFVFFADILLQKLKEKLLEENMLFNPRTDIKIEVAVLKNDAGIIGATLI